MFRGFRKKCAATNSSSRGTATRNNDNAEHDDDKSLSFVGGERKEGIQANQDLRATYEAFQVGAVSDSPVKRIAEKLEGIPPALQFISDAKKQQQSPEMTHRATQNYEQRMEDVQLAVDSFLAQRRLQLEREQAEKHVALGS